MKQIVAILGSKQHGNTHNLLLFLQAKFQKQNIRLEIVVLNEFNIEDCQGCEMCVLGKGCVLQDDMALIMAKMQNADGIIVASPVYNNNVSGKMKMFIDKTAKWAHSPILTQKPYLGVTTTSSSGLNFTLKYLTMVGMNWGAHTVGNIWASKRTINRNKNMKVLNKFIKVILQDSRFHRINLKQMMLFQTKKALAKTVFPNDFEYWNEQGWLKQHYYYECKINPLIKMTGYFFQWMMFKILSNSMKKNETKIGTKEYGKLVFI